MNDFDKIARYAAKSLDAEGFLRWLHAPAFRHWRWAGWLDTQTVAFPGEPDRRCDTVALFEHRGGQAPPAALVVEMQTEARARTMPRLVEYKLRVHGELPQQQGPKVTYTVAGALLNLTGTEQSPDWAMAPPDFGGLGLWARVKVLNLPKEDAQKTLARIARQKWSNAVLAWVPLMAGADTPALVAEWRRLADREPNEQMKGDLKLIANVFAGLVNREAVWKRGLEGWTVLRSKVFDEIRAEGEVSGLRAGILCAIESRFGPAAAALAAAVEAEEDLPRLRRWLKQSMTASLDDLTVAIQRR